MRASAELCVPRASARARRAGRTLKTKPALAVAVCTACVRSACSHKRTHARRRGPRDQHTAWLLGAKVPHVAASDEAHAASPLGLPAGVLALVRPNLTFFRRGVKILCT
jgi:hypothetical protein